MKEDNNTTETSEETVSQEQGPKPETVMTEGEKTTNGYGAMIAIGVIVIIILGGAFYFFNTRVAPNNGTSQADLETQFQAAQNTAKEEIDAIGTQSESTSIDAIQADINASDVSDLDAEISALSQELNL